MFSRRYDIYNFEDIVENFLDFCAHEDGNDGIFILRSKYNDWQGTTLAIPIDDYKQNTEIVENICILTDGTPAHVGYHAGETISWNVIYRGDYNFQKPLPTLFDYLKHLFPNSSIKQYSYTDYILDPSISTSLLDHILDNVRAICTSNDVDKFIFSFSDFSPEFTSSTIKAFLDDVNDICMENNVKLFIVYTPSISFSEEFNNSIESYIYVDKPVKILNFFNCICEFYGGYDEAKALLLDEEVYAHEFLQDINKAYYSYNTLVYPLNPTYSCALSLLYIRFILSNIFHVDREEYYVSLMYSENPKSWYSQLFTTYNEYMVEEFNYDQYRHGGWSIQSKYGSNPPNIFKNTGQLVSVGVHTSYDPFLWMCEQGGITCKKEEDEQIEDLDLMGFYAFLNGSPNKKVKPPVFPTTGCPWFTISSKNIADYDIANCPAKLYITRVGSSFILTVRVIDANGQKPDLWQSITFGEFVGRIDGYNIDQFYCAGGNQALSPDSWTYFATSHIIGLQMDLDMKNSSIVNSNILHPSKFEKTNLSNFRIMNGEGTWEDIYSATQGYKEYQYLDGDGNPTIFTWGVPLTKPNFNLSNNLNTAYPYLDWQHKIDSYTINKYDLKKNDMSGKIDPLTVYLAK